MISFLAFTFKVTEINRVLAYDLQAVNEFVINSELLLFSRKTVQDFSIVIMFDNKDGL